MDLKCEVCGYEDGNLDTVSYYDINGNSHDDEQDIENNVQNPDALAHILCTECAEKFEFEGGYKI